MGECSGGGHFWVTPSLTIQAPGRRVRDGWGAGEENAASAALLRCAPDPAYCGLVVARWVITVCRRLAGSREGRASPVSMLLGADLGGMVREVHLDYFRPPGMSLLTKSSPVPSNKQVCLFVFV